jgi:putative Holliday junction resolvase
MKILGIDWGEKRIGLAISDGNLAEPLGVVGSVKELKEVIRQEGTRQAVLGLPEGKHQKAVKRLGRRLKEGLGVEVIYRSEVLTSRQALQAAIKSGKKKKARRNLDAFAAAIILQEYLDSFRS